jgi:cardiolipin synthase
MNGTNSLVEQIQQIAATLPATQIDQLAGVVTGLVGPDDQGRARAVSLTASPGFKKAVTSLWQAWATEPTTPGAAVALALRSAALTTDRLRAASSLEVVWTGPTSNQVPVRKSAQVLERLIDDARKRLIIVSYAAYKVASVDERLRAAADRGVAIDLVLETEADSKGELRQDAADAFEALHGVATFWVWPATARPEQGAVLHAKAAIRDTSAALVTSANFTGRALERNMELGLLITGGPVPRRLAEHFDALMASGELRPLQGG